jgi:hypothetical protein
LGRRGIFFVLENKQCLAYDIAEMAKEIDIIPIAERKLEKRGIRRDWIEDAVKNPTQVVEGYGGRKVGHKESLYRGKNIF